MAFHRMHLCRNPLGSRRRYNCNQPVKKVACPLYERYLPSVFRAGRKRSITSNIQPLESGQFLVLFEPKFFTVCLWRTSECKLYESNATTWLGKRDLSDANMNLNLTINVRYDLRRWKWVFGPSWSVWLLPFAKWFLAFRHLERAFD